MEGSLSVLQLVSSKTYDCCKCTCIHYSVIWRTSEYSLSCTNFM